MRVRLRTLIVVIVATLALVMGAGAFASPARAAVPPAFSSSTLTIDCGSLQPGYYSAARLSTSLSGLAPNTAYVVGTDRSGPWEPTVPSNPVSVITDASGSAVVDTALSGQFTSGGWYLLTVWEGNTILARTGPTANTCASGVHVSGAPTVTLDCPLRFLTPQGESATAVDLTADLGGLVPGQPYVVDIVSTSGSPGAYGTVTARPDGTIAFEQTGQRLVHMATDSYTWYLKTDSQAGQLASGVIATTTDPCAPIAKAPKRAGLTHDSDITGDGFADLLVTDITGRLLLYPNGINANPGRVPFTSSRSIGTGWNSLYGMRSVTMGDLSGDGVADLVAIRSDGTLAAYYNNIGSSPAGLPFSSATVVGSGWQPFVSISLGDVDGDGYADIVADRQDGTRWLYKNRFATDSLHRPFSIGVQLATDGVQNDSNGHGSALADLNGDGYADLTPGGYSLDLNRIPAGNKAPFPAAVPIAQPGSMQPALDGWSVGDYEGRGSSGIVAADPGRSGLLLYLKDPLVPDAQPTVIGSGWSVLYTLVP